MDIQTDIQMEGGTLLTFLQFILALIIPFSKPRGQGWKEATKWEIFLFLFPPPHSSVNGKILAFNSTFIPFHYPSFLCHSSSLPFASPLLFIKSRSIYTQEYTRQRQLQKGEGGGDWSNRSSQVFLMDFIFLQELQDSWANYANCRFK